MLVMDAKMLTDSFLTFAQKASNLMHIKNKRDYKEAQKFIEHLLEEAEDTRDDPLNKFIDLISKSIQEYEEDDERLSSFMKEINETDPSVSTLRLIIDQYQLKSNDLKELIGSKSLVSMILNGKRSLTREHISKLSSHFNISPSLFF
ncbi:MAG: helix-turn-helix domain-containing protein [Deltaproteobacteria bacterium]|nr:helix-turn-helix domain-containing protein [Deltaproteobacteria bacterium]